MWPHIKYIVTVLGYQNIFWEEYKEKKSLQFHKLAPRLLEKHRYNYVHNNETTFTVLQEQRKNCESQIRKSLLTRIHKDPFSI